jgi:hypothetical protein
MIDKININQHLIESGSSPGQANPARALPNNDADVSVQVSYASLIEQATQSPQEDAQLVEKARALLLSGQLETLQNIREAAENMVKFGV